MDNETMEILAGFPMAAKPIVMLGDDKFIPMICTMMELHCMATGADVREFAKMVAEFINGANAKEDKE